MEFSVELLNGLRCGTLSRSLVKQETPCAMLYTRLGSVPYLSMEAMNYLENAPKIAHVPLAPLVQHDETLSMMKASLPSLEKYWLFTTIQDGVAKTGHNTRKEVAVWGSHGKSLLNSDRLASLIGSIRPCFFQSLCDGDTPEGSGKKRVQKAKERTENYLEEMQQIMKDKAELQECCVMAAIEGGFDLREREKCAKMAAKQDVFGFTLDGFGSIELKWDEVEHMIQKTLEHLPRDKPRYLPALWSPLLVLNGIKLGLDLFDSKYVYIQTELRHALSFPLEEAENSTDQTEYLDFSDERFITDKGPILQKCSCYACKTFSRAYLYHLLKTGELLGSTLLMIHNLHHYFLFFELLRTKIQTRKFDSYVKFIETSLRSNHEHAQI